MNPPPKKKERKPKYFHPSDIFSIVSTGKICRSLCLTGRERSGDHAGRSHDRPPRQHGHSEPIAAFPWPRCSPPTTNFTRKGKQTNKQKKNTFYIPHIFMHISQYTFIIILINTKNDTVIPKEDNGY